MWLLINPRTSAAPPWVSKRPSSSGSPSGGYREGTQSQVLGAGRRKRRPGRLGGASNYLGEDVTDLAQAREFDEYLRIQRAIHEAGIDGAASVKLTQFGLMVDEGLTLERGRQVTVNAESLGRCSGSTWRDRSSRARQSRSTSPSSGRTRTVRHHAPGVREEERS